MLINEFVIQLSNDNVHVCPLKDELQVKFVSMLSKDGKLSALYSL